MTEADLTRAVELFRHSVSMDPEFALGWTGLSRAYWTQAGYGWRPVGEGYEMARETAKRALAIAPDLAEGHVCLGMVLQSYDWDWNAALAQFQRALDIEPGNAEVLRAYGAQVGFVGRTEESLDILRRAVALDPLSATGQRLLGLRCAIYGHLPEGEAALRAALDLNPGVGLANCFLSVVHLFQGRAAEALERAQREVLPMFRSLGIALAEHSLGHAAESDRALSAVIDGFGDAAGYQVAEACAWRGEKERAFEWLERSYAQRDPGLAHVKTDRFFASLHDDPRWPLFLKKMGLL
jgi:tetratricopeptide (TPR) repeat protein